VGVPDAKAVLIAYAKHDEQAFEIPRRMNWHPDWCDTLMHQVNYHERSQTRGYFMRSRSGERESHSTDKLTGRQPPRYPSR
jgi:hypothetical protein